MSKSVGVFSTLESIERLAVWVDEAITNVKCDIQRINEQYEADVRKAEEYKKLPFFTRLNTRRPIVDGNDIFYRRPALRYNLELFNEVNNMIAMGCSEIRVDVDTLSRIKGWCNEG